MKKSILVLVAGMVFTACMKEESLPPSISNEANGITQEKAMVTRPMMVNFYATPNQTLPPVPCVPAPNVFVAGGLIIHGTATHIGLVNPANSFGTVLNCNMGPQPFELSTQQTGQVAAANGDLLYYSSTEVINVINGTVTGVVNLTGGTGRFMGASGSVNVQGTVNLQTGFAQWTGTGTITY